MIESRKELAARLIAECQADIAGLEAIKIPPHDPTIAIEELLAGYLLDDREDHWEAIQAYADIHARRAVQINSSQSQQPAQVNRIPAGLYAELEALRTLRDATDVYLKGYMQDEIEDEESCSADQHDAACSVKGALDNARALEWKGGGEGNSHG